MAELATATRTTIVMPCGTGKTLVGAAVGAESKRVLLLFPSISLIRQTLDVWRAEELTKNRKILVVCSDKQAADNDDVTVTEQELGCHITTNGEEAREFFENAPVCVVFTTYHSASIVQTALPPDYQFDIAIFDEAHRTAQDNSSQFTVALDDKAIQCALRLFMTATPRFTAKAGFMDGHSMNNEGLYGRICHQLSHQEAVERELICETKTIIGATSHNELKGLLERSSSLQQGRNAIVDVAQAISIRRAMDIYDIKKVVTFHRTIAEAEQFSTQTDVRNELKVPCFFIHGRMPADERERILAEFGAAESAVISNARCLTEGVDIPSIDMVAFMSPKRSVVDVVQAVGRSVRKAANKSAGYVLIPLVAKLDDGKIDKSQFNEVFSILTSLIEEASVIAYQTASKRAGQYNWRKAVADKLGGYTIISDDIDTHELREQIQVYCETRSVHTFDHWYPILCEQYRKHGQILSGKDRGTDQVEWERYVRAVHREGRLSVEKEKMLTAIGFNWSRSQDDRWDDRYEALKSYLLEKKGKRNDRFVAEQRAQFKAGKLSAERANKLRELGLSLSPRDEDSRQGIPVTSTQKPSPKEHGTNGKPKIDTAARISELMKVLTNYDRRLISHLDAVTATNFTTVREHYQKLLNQYRGETLFSITALSHAIGQPVATIEHSIADGLIPPPVIKLGEHDKAWSLLHLSGIELNLGPEMAANDPTRAWYGTLLKEELAKTKRG